jgi:hypothetical protein
MSTKPTGITEWALNDSVEVRGGGNNKIEPTTELKNNGSLDGSFSLNHLNFMLNNLGLWSRFLSEFVVIKDGNGLAVIKDDHSAFIVAFDKTTLSRHIVAVANKSGALAPITHTIQNSTLTLGTPTIDGNIPISGAIASNIIVLSLNFKL